MMKAMDSARRLGANRSDTFWYREAEPGRKQSRGLFAPGEGQGLWPCAACKVLQRRHRVEDALSCFDTSGLQY